MNAESPRRTCVHFISTSKELLQEFVELRLHETIHHSETYHHAAAFLIVKTLTYRGIVSLSSEQGKEIYTLTFPARLVGPPTRNLRR